MLFTEPTFLFVFLPILLALYQLPGARYRNWLLLAASIIFYTRGAGSFTWLVLALIGFNYAAARLIDRHRATVLGRRLLASAIAIDLLVLAVFKYADFAVGNLNVALALAGAQPFALPGILLPIGISFFTFHAISYVVDVYRRDAAAQKRPVEAALYLLVFPQLVAGPIVRYRQIAEQLSVRVTSMGDFAYGIRRFVIGLSKKMLIANTLAAPADQIFPCPPRR
jgi:alginate O-acetyltransferase complex protein AlgI